MCCLPGVNIESICEGCLDELHRYLTVHILQNMMRNRTGGANEVILVYFGG